ncbi:MAG TPA: FtsX-like permease family protein [Blastocatellia bacterium]|nr:FtsX-like permease family protein [Blastocatellia bacterium]
MFFLIIRRALTQRGGRVVVALVALVVGASVAAAMLSVYYDAQQKMSRELRAYGANLMLSPAYSTGFIEQRVLNEIAGGGWPAEITGAEPYLYLVINASPTAGNAGDVEAIRAVLAGTWLDQAKKVTPWWEVEGRWIEDRANASDCIVGRRLASQLGVRLGDAITVNFAGADDGETRRRGDTATGRHSDVSQQFTVAGVLTTGSAEEDQIFVSLEAAQRLGGMAGRVSAIGLSVVGGSEVVEALADRIRARFDFIRPSPVRQIAESEGRILGKLRLMMLLVTVLIMAGAAISVATTLTALVIERRREIGTMKAIGAADSQLMRLFLFQLGALGVIGGVAGYGVGLGLAQLISRSLFDSVVTPHAAVFAVVVLLTLTIALLSGVVPIKKIREVEPAVMLRGE